MPPRLVRGMAGWDSGRTSSIGAAPVYPSGGRDVSGSTSPAFQPVPPTPLARNLRQAEPVKQGGCTEIPGAVNWQAGRRLRTCRRVRVARR